MQFFWQGNIGISIVLSVITIIFCFIYFVKTKKEGRIYQIVLSGLRFFSLTLIVFLFLNPLVKWTENELFKSNLNVILDSSESMENYSNEIKLFLNSIDSIKIKNDIDINIFSNLNQKFEKEYNPSYPQTDFSDIDKIVNNNPHDINLLLSDGNINSGLDYNSISKLIQNPIYTIGVGNKKNGNDLKIVDLNYSNYQLKNETFELKYTIQALLDTNITVTSIFENSKGILNKEYINLDKGFSNRDFIIEIDGYKLENINTLKLSTTIVEDNIENNMSEIFVEILDDKRDVLFISGEISENTSYIKNLIEKQPRIHLHHSKRIGNRWYNKWTDELIQKSKLIVIEGFPTKTIDQDFFENAIIQKIPILYFSGPFENSITKSNFQNYFNFTTDKVNGNLSFNFLENSKFQNINDFPSQNRNNTWFHNDQELSYSDESSAITLIGINLFVFIPDILKLQLKLNKNGNENTINKYLNNFIEKTLNIDSHQITISTQLENLKLHEKNEFIIAVNHELNAKILEKGLKVVHEDNIYFEQLDSVDKKIVHYTPNKDGLYTLNGYFISENLDTVWSKPINISVLKLYAEQMTKSLNEIGLKNLAENSGGTYSHFDDYLNLIENLNFTEENKIINKSASAFDYQKLWIIIALLLIVEWGLRKRNGLL